MEDSKANRGTLSRCYHCAGPLCKDMEASHWTVPPFVRDSFSMIGSAVGGTTSAFYGFNHVMPIVQKWVKGPMWLHFLIGVSSIFSSLFIYRASHGTTSYSFLFSLCRFSRWCGSSLSATSFFILPRCSFIFPAAFFVFRR